MQLTLSDSAVYCLRESAPAYHCMPPPQYLGAKHRLLPWIGEFIAAEAETVLDGFAGSQSFAFEMKRRGLAVHSNDFLAFSCTAGSALIENDGETLTSEELEMLCAPAAEEAPRDGTMMRFADIFFSADECAFLDAFRARVERLDNPHKRALALAVMCRCLTRKTTMGHFAHLCAIPYANDPLRVKRNPNIARPARDVFLEMVPAYNAAVFDNGRRCKSYRANILDLLPELSTADIDLAYYDPPYCKSHADYQAFYHLLETFVERWDDKQFVNRTRRYHPPRHSGFDKVSEVEESFRRLFALSDEIRNWLISYNDRSYPAIDALVGMAKRHKSVRVEEHMYRASRGGKGSVKGSREYLLICN